MDAESSSRKRTDPLGARKRAELIGELRSGLQRLDKGVAKVQSISDNVRAGLDAADAVLHAAGKLPFLGVPCEVARELGWPTGSPLAVGDG